MRLSDKLRRRVAPGYATEAELCDDVIAWARAGGCRVFPETGGWDVLIVMPTGEQVGVEAKLRPGLEVVAQAVRHARETQAPDIVAIALPRYDQHLEEIASALRMTVICGVGITPRGHTTFDRWVRTATRRITTERCWVPDVEVDIRGGTPGPRSLTPWKFGAVKLCARLRAGEVLTRKDFDANAVGVDSWVQKRVVRRVGSSRPARYERFPLAEGGAHLPDAMYPEIVAALGLPRIDAEC